MGAMLGIAVLVAALAAPAPPIAQDAAPNAAQDVAPTAGPGVVVGVLDFSIVSDRGRPIPGRLTFVGPGEAQSDLFPGADALPEALAARKNVVYTLTGRGRITVPAGTYRVCASRGLEWSVATRELTIEPEATTRWTARLEHEVDTTGWISGDFHLHTLTYSGHGDANLNERIISIVGEGIEFAVATDHNHNTDYHPTIDHLHAGDDLTAVTGNEVSVPVGHFNAFPLDPERPPVDKSIGDANRLFRLLRAETNDTGIVPVIQVNHPRWAGIDYFEIAGLDPADGVSTSGRYSENFDTIEVLNENAGWGYYQAFVDDVPTSANVQSVLQDWYNLLNRGHRYAAVGNSDSHTVHYALAGYPRNFVRSATDDPAAIAPADVATALRERAVFTTTGPFVSFSVNDAPIGGETTAVDGHVELAIRVQAASWIDCDRVKVVVNGDVIATIDVPDTREVVRLDTRYSLPIGHDSWVALLIEGDDDLAPIVDGGKRPVRPLAVVNPVWVDGDGDGEWRSPWDRARRAVAWSPTRADLDRYPDIGTGPSERGLLLSAAVDAADSPIPALGHKPAPYAPDLVREGLGDPDRRVRLRAARGAERLTDPALLGALTRAVDDEDADPYLRVALLRAISRLDTGAFTRALATVIEQDGDRLPTAYRRELAAVLPGSFVEDWYAIGYFPAPDAGTVARVEFGPESDSDLSRVYEGKDGATVRWTRVRANDSGYLDLRDLATNTDAAQNAAVCIQTWLYTPEDREVVVALGTDDGSRIYLNGEVVYENTARRAASPLEHVATWHLRAGLNRVLLKIENGTGGFGAYFRVLDASLRTTAEPE